MTHYEAELRRQCFYEVNNVPIRIVWQKNMYKYDFWYHITNDTQKRLGSVWINFNCCSLFGKLSHFLTFSSNKSTKTSHHRISYISRTVIIFDHPNPEFPFFQKRPYSPSFYVSQNLNSITIMYSRYHFFSFLFLRLHYLLYYFSYSQWIGLVSSHVSIGLASLFFSF